MTDDSRMVSYPVPAPPDSLCPECGMPRNTPGSRHCVRAAAASRCAEPGCKRRPLTECWVGADRVAMWEPAGGHRWRKP